MEVFLEIIAPQGYLTIGRFFNINDALVRRSAKSQRDVAEGLDKRPVDDHVDVLKQFSYVAVFKVKPV